MLHYKAFSNSTRAMPLEVSSEIFAAAWKATFKDPDGEHLEFLEIVEPFIQFWKRQLSDRSSPPTIHLVSLCAKLDSHFGDQKSLEAIELFCLEAGKLSCLEDELRFILISQLKTMKYFPEFARPKSAEFVFAQEYKSRLKRRIRRIAQRHIDVVSPGLNFDRDGSWDNYPDHLLIKNLGLNRWEEYLFLLIQQGMNPLEMASTFHIPRETFYYEEKHLWQRLRQMYCDTEE